MNQYHFQTMITSISLLLPSAFSRACGILFKNGALRIRELFQAKLWPIFYGPYKKTHHKYLWKLEVELGNKEKESPLSHADIRGWGTSTLQMEG
jgi:hypothetical protein